MSQILAAFPWLPLLWLVPIGAATGSFINCLMDRIPRKVSLRQPPSFCDSCGTTLGWKELIPLVSWLLQRGRCRHCGAHVPVRNFWLEVFTTLIPLVLFALTNGHWLFVPATLAAWVLVGVVAIQSQRVS